LKTKKKHDRDEYLLGLDEAENPDSPFPKWNWGMSLHHWGEHERAILKLEECLALAKPTDSMIRKVYSLLTASNLALNRLDEARSRLDMGLSLYPRDPEMLFRAGNFYRQLGAPAAAERFFLRLFNNAETGHIDSIDVSTTTFKGRHNYAMALMDLNRFDDAEAQLRTGLADYPAFSPSWLLLGDLYIRRRRFDDARGALERLESLQSPYAETLRAQLSAAQSTRVI
jgi:tetratricopeptide (TPR) repeat protein